MRCSSRFERAVRVALRLVSLVAVLVLIAVRPGVAQAQSDADKATARALASEAQDALDRSDFATAADKFRRADALYHVPTLALGLARADHRHHGCCVLGGGATSVSAPPNARRSRGPARGVPGRRRAREGSKSRVIAISNTG